MTPADPTPVRPRRSHLARHWTLAEDAVYLNHGSFGACPRTVLEVQSVLRARLESQPVRFFLTEYPQRLAEARGALAEFLGAAAGDLAFVANATAGVNCLLAAFDLGPGDEVVVTDHEYPACRTAVDLLCRRRGAEVRVARIPFPLAEEDDAVDAVLACIGPETRLLLIDHVTSQTGLVLPVARIAAAARGVPVIVDGAHAPGMLELEIARLGVDGYAGNCHKWLCAPKGAGFVWVRPSLRERVRPPVLSHGAASEDDRFRAAFDWTGTFDPTPWFCVPDAIAVLGGMVDDGWEEVRRHNHELAVAGRRLLCAALDAAPPCPERLLGAMASVPLPDGEGPADHFGAPPLQAALWDRFRIEVPVIAWPRPPHRLLRISAQLYNSLEQYEFLAEALRELLTEE